MPPITVDQLESSIQTGTLEFVYLFDGPEVWLKNREIENITHKLIPPEAKDFNFEKFNANDASAGSVIASARSLPFLSERRLILVQDVDQFSTADSNLLADSLRDLPTSTCLILLQTPKAHLRDVLPAAVNSHGVLVTFWTPFPNQLPTWVRREVRTRGKTIEMDAAQALGESCSDLQEISNELDKLILFVGKKPVISWADVMAHGLPDLSGDQKEFEEALFTRNMKMALHHAHLMGEVGIRPEMLIGTIERVFRSLILAHYYKEEKGWGLEEMEATLRIRGMTQRNLFRQAMRIYHRGEVESALEKVIDADYQMKTGVLPGNVAVSLLLVALLGRGKTVRR